MGVLVLALAAPPDAELRSEQAKLAGNWRMVSVEADGVKMSNQQAGGLSLNFKDGTFTSTNKGDTSKFGSETIKRTGTYTIDPAKTPKVLDIVHADGPDKDKTWSLIYSMDGNTLKICGAIEVDKERPTSFDTEGKKGLILLILRHE
jgi:uncharacterized protein (TIGR03067 family)